MRDELLCCAACGVTLTRASASLAGWQSWTEDRARRPGPPKASPVVRCGWCSLVARGAERGTHRGPAMRPSAITRA